VRVKTYAEKLSCVNLYVRP